MMGLAPHLGRQQAHDMVYEACRAAVAQKRSLFDVLVENPAISAALSADRLRALNAVVELCVPYERGDILAALHREGEVLVEIHDERATRVRARLPKGGADRFRPFFPGASAEPPGEAS